MKGLVVFVFSGSLLKALHHRPKILKVYLVLAR